MSSYMQVTPLDVEPFMLISENDRNQTPIEDYTIWPPLAAAPRRVKFSESKEQMVGVFDLRLQFEGTIGTPADTTDPSGIRVFSTDDVWLLFGGTGAQDARMFRRAGPGYLPYAMPSAFTDLSPIKMAVFSDDRKHLFVVSSDGVTDTASMWNWDGESWTFGADAETPDGENIVSIFYVAAGGYFVTQTTYAPNASVLLHKVVGGGLEAVDTADYFRTGRLVAVSPDGADWIFTPGNVATDPLIVCRWVSGELIQQLTLPGSGGTSRQGMFTPNGRLFIILGTANSGFDMPIWYSIAAGVYTLTGGRNYEATAGAFTGKVAADSSKVLVWSGTRLVVYEPGDFVGDDIADAADPLGITATRPTVATPLSISKDGRYLFTKTSTTTNRYFWNGSAFVITSTTGTGIPTNTGALGFAISPDGEYYVMGGANSDTRYLSFFKRNAGSDTAFTQLPNASKPPTGDCPSNIHGGISAMSFSPDGQHLVVLTPVTPYIWMYKRTGDVFSRITTIPTLAGPANSAEFSPDGTYLALGSPLAMWKRGGDNYAALGAPDIAGTGVKLAWSPDSNRIGLVSAGGVTFYRRINDNLYRLDLVPSQTPYAGSQQIAWTDDSRVAFLGRNGAGSATPYLRAFRFGSDDSYEEMALPVTLPTTGLIALAVQPGTGLVVAYAGGSAAVRYYKYSSTEGLLTLHEDYFTSSGSTPAIADGAIAPDGSLLHFTRAGVGEHRETDAYALLTRLNFDPAADPADITRVLYGFMGSAVIWENDGKNGLAIRPSGGNSDYINIRELRGTFVSLYDREGEQYVERSYAIHPVGAKITDIQLSKTPVSMSYNCKLAEDIIQGAKVGRIVYDIRDTKFLEMGVIWREGDFSSLFAYSPFESYFVNVTMNTSDGVSAIRLFSMGGTTELLSFEQVDVEEVLYGPPTFSNCDTVVVAHGGPIPFTLYARVADELVYREITIKDWESEEFVLAVTFTEDCTGLIIVLPDKIVVIGEDPENPDEWVPTDEMPYEEEDPDDTDTDIIIDEDLVVVDPGDPGDPPTLGDFDPDDKTIDDITYIPYVSVSVTYRTW